MGSDLKKIVGLQLDGLRGYETRDIPHPVL
jgi:hypothetical protein